VKISKIEPQKKNKKRSSVYINGSYAFGLSNEVLLNFDLHEGDQIDDDVIQNILLAQEKQKIRERALRILHYRKRSALELQSRLFKVGFVNKLIQEVIVEFLGYYTFKDENFAE
jgi:regulatory protein